MAPYKSSILQQKAYTMQTSPSPSPNYLHKPSVLNSREPNLKYTQQQKTKPSSPNKMLLELKQLAPYSTLLGTSVIHNS